MDRSRGDTAVGLPRGAFRPSPIFLGILALFVTSGWMAWSEYGSARFNLFMFVIAGWVLSLCLHEYAHAVLAYRAGDRAVAERGYLTLNPLKYTHPILSIVLPVVFLLLGGIGLPGGAVWVDRHAIPGRLKHSLISVAGPAANLVLAVILIVPVALADVVAHRTFWVGVAFLGFLQLTAALLNLLPIPGVDGGNMIEPWLSPAWQRGFAHVAPFGMLLLFALLATPRISGAFFTVVGAVGSLLGLPMDAVAEGFRMFRFWS